MKRVCIQWPNLGPYHLARLSAAHTHFARYGVEIVAVETAGADRTNAWQRQAQELPFTREQVFPGAHYEDLTPSRIRSGVLELLDRLRPDAVAINSYSLPDAQACLTWCRRHRCTAVVVTESQENDAPRQGWREHLKSILLRQYDAALAAGMPHRTYLKTLGFPDDQIFLGSSVVDNAYFCNEAAEARQHPERYRHLPGLADPTPFFLASGRFIPRKNFEFLLLAFHQYRSMAREPWRLVLLGDGAQRSQLETLIRDRGITGVTLAGLQGHDVLGGYYGLASAFVHPALREQWGLVVNEAMAAGLPVLVSAHAGCAQDLVADGENGFRFDPRDLNGLAERMDRIASSPEQRAAMSRRSQEIIAKWSPQRYAAGLWQAIQAGAARANRPLDAAGRLVLWTLTRASRDIRSFHSVEA